MNEGDFNLMRDDGNADEIILPITINPPIRCYRIHAYIYNIIIHQYTDFTKYIASNYLCLHNGREGVRQEYLDFHIYNYFDSIYNMFYDNSWFDIIQLKAMDYSSTYISEKEIKRIIIDFLNNNYYILHKVNEEYLPHSDKYARESFYNIDMTIGYDFYNDMFLLLDYQQSGHFGISKVSSEEYLKSISTVNVKNALNFIKIKPGLSFEFDRERAIKLLDCHINSKPLFKYKAYEPNIFGYDAVDRSISYMKDSGINLIRLRTIKEHKKIISNFMQISSTLGYDPATYYTQYKEIEHKMDIIFMKIIKKWEVNYQDYTNEIYLVEELNKVESDFLNNYIQKLKS